MGNNNIIIITARPHQFLTQFGTGNYYYINGGLMNDLNIIVGAQLIDCKSKEPPN